MIQPSSEKKRRAFLSAQAPAQGRARHCAAPGLKQTERAPLRRAPPGPSPLRPPPSSSFLTSGCFPPLDEVTVTPIVQQRRRDVLCFQVETRLLFKKTTGKQKVGTDWWGAGAGLVAECRCTWLRPARTFLTLFGLFSVSCYSENVSCSCCLLKISPPPSPLPPLFHLPSCFCVSD